MIPDVRHARHFQEFLTPEGCWILEVANDEADPAASVARARVPPGVTTEWHRLAGVFERYVIVSGTGRVELTPTIVKDVEPGDVVRIPAGVGQRITNTGATDLVFLCVCTPRFTPESYERIEKL
jgi:mannose-6-phosphate isomerase-like protein (cupin superfamily)